jgi:hypothetical protein
LPIFSTSLGIKWLIAVVVGIGDKWKRILHFTKGGTCRGIDVTKARMWGREGDPVPPAVGWNFVQAGETSIAVWGFSIYMGD